MNRLRVALDQNFPVTIVGALQKSIIETELTHVTAIDPRFALVDDDELIRLLWLRGWDLLATCDHHMLDEPRVLATILQTKMTVVAAVGQGHDYVAASGLLLAHLPHIAHEFRKDVPQVWQLRVGRKPPDDPWNLLDRVAKRQTSATSQSLYASHKRSNAALRHDPFAGSK